MHAVSTEYEDDRYATCATRIGNPPTLPHSPPAPQQAQPANGEMRIEPSPFAQILHRVVYDRLIPRSSHHFIPPVSVNHVRFRPLFDVGSVGRDSFDEFHLDEEVDADRDSAATRNLCIAQALSLKEEIQMVQATLQGQVETARAEFIHQKENQQQQHDQQLEALRQYTADDHERINQLTQSAPSMALLESSVESFREDIDSRLRAETNEFHSSLDGVRQQCQSMAEEFDALKRSLLCEMNFGGNNSTENCAAMERSQALMQLEHEQQRLRQEQVLQELQGQIDQMKQEVNVQIRELASKHSQLSVPPPPFPANDTSTQTDEPACIDISSKQSTSSEVPVLPANPMRAHTPLPLMDEKEANSSAGGGQPDHTLPTQMRMVNPWLTEDLHALARQPEEDEERRLSTECQIALGFNLTIATEMLLQFLKSNSVQLDETHRRDRLKRIQVLLSSSADGLSWLDSVRDERGWPLGMCASEDIELLRFLHQIGSNIFLPTIAAAENEPMGSTILHHVIRTMNVDAVTLLLEEVDVQPSLMAVRNDAKQTPIDVFKDVRQSSSNSVSAYRIQKLVRDWSQRHQEGCEEISRQQKLAYEKRRADRKRKKLDASHRCPPVHTIDCAVNSIPSDASSASFKSNTTAAAGSPPKRQKADADIPTVSTRTTRHSALMAKSKLGTTVSTDLPSLPVDSTSSSHGIRSTARAKRMTIPDRPSMPKRSFATPSPAPSTTPASFDPFDISTLPPAETNPCQQHKLKRRSGISKPRKNKTAPTTTMKPATIVTDAKTAAPTSMPSASVHPPAVSLAVMTRSLFGENVEVEDVSHLMFDPFVPPQIASMKRT